MGTYAATSDVSARLGGRAVDATSNPTATQVGTMIDEAEAELLGTLAAFEVSAPAAGTSGGNILRGWVADYIAGLVRGSHAAAGGDGTNDDGLEYREKWRALLERIERKPTVVSSMLGGGGADSATVQTRSHVTDTAGKTSADFTATITSSEVW